MIRTYSRAHVKDQSLRNSGPYEAIIVNHHDPMYMGSLEVEILKYSGAGNAPTRTGQLVIAKYLSPFYGVTPASGLTNNDAFHQTQKSYGFWMIPPDVGTRVLVIFAEGDPVNAYWIGCIQDTYMNFMLPDGKAATELTTDATPGNLKDLKLPVGEYSKVNETGAAVDPTLFLKPYNKDFTEVLEIQGLIFDEARGLTTSSARRETPSAVFGVSTPGPLDKRQQHPTVKYGPTETSVDVPYNRLGGSSFVMDDGDDKFTRATHAADGPPLYVNKERGEEGGDETIPQNECIRIRTRTGHQILLHNSEDLIYIANSRGTAWIELTSDGKIDIHADDSVSIHSEQDFNFRAERDINLESGRNINMRASASWSDGHPTLNGYTSGNIQMHSSYDVSVKGGRSTIFDVNDILDLNIPKGIRVATDGDFNLKAQNIVTEAKASVNETAGHSWYRKAGTTLTDQAESDYFTQIGGEVHVNANRSIYHSSKDLMHMQAKSIATNGQDFNVQSATFSVDSPSVDLNGGTSISATAAKTFTRPASTASAATAAVMSTITLEELGEPNTGSPNSPQFVLPPEELKALLEVADPVTGYTGSNEIIYDEFGDPIAGYTGSAAYVGTGGYASSDTEQSTFNSPTIPAIANTYGGIGQHNLPRVRPGMTHPVMFDSIMKRVPQHEPWPHHENYDPRSFKPEMTDSLTSLEYYSADRVLTPDTFMKNMAGRTTSVFVDGSGGMSASSVGGMAAANYVSGPVGEMPPIVEGSRDPLPPGVNAFIQIPGRDGPRGVVRTKSGLTATVALVFQGNFQGLLNDLEATGYRITSLGEGGWSRRKAAVPGKGYTSANWSYHSLGAALDINPGTNPYYLRTKKRSKTITDMPSNITQIAAKWGLGWGGNWRTTMDAMHFTAAKNEGGSFDLPTADGMIPFPPNNTVVDNKDSTS